MKPQQTWDKEPWEAGAPQVRPNSSPKGHDLCPLLTHPPRISGAWRMFPGQVNSKPGAQTPKHACLPCSETKSCREVTSSHCQGPCQTTGPGPHGYNSLNATPQASGVPDRPSPRPSGQRLRSGCIPRAKDSQCPRRAQLRPKQPRQDPAGWTDERILGHGHIAPHFAPAPPD